MLINFQQFGQYARENGIGITSVVQAAGTLVGCVEVAATLAGGVADYFIRPGAAIEPYATGLAMKMYSGAGQAINAAPGIIGATAGAVTGVGTAIKTLLSGQDTIYLPTHFHNARPHVAHAHRINRLQRFMRNPITLSQEKIQAVINSANVLAMGTVALSGEALNTGISSLARTGEYVASTLIGTTTPERGATLPFGPLRAADQPRIAHALNANWFQRLIRHPIGFSEEAIQAGVNEARNAVVARYAPIGAGIEAVGGSLATMSDLASKGFISLIAGIPVIGGGILLSSWAQAKSVASAMATQSAALKTHAIAQQALTKSIRNGFFGLGGLIALTNLHKLKPVAESVKSGAEKFIGWIIPSMRKEAEQVYEIY